MTPEKAPVAELSNPLTLVDEKVRAEAERTWRHRPLARIQQEVSQVSARLHQAAEQTNEGDDFGDTATALDGKTPDERFESFCTLHSTLAGLTDAAAKKQATQALSQRVPQADPQPQGQPQGGGFDLNVSDGTKPEPQGQGLPTDIQPLNELTVPRFGVLDGAMSHYENLKAQQGGNYPIANYLRAFGPNGWHDPSIDLLNMLRPDYLAQAGRILDAQAMNATFTTAAGYGQDVRRMPGIQWSVQRPAQMLSLIPVYETQQQSVKYQLEGTYTDTAAAKAEGTALTESTYVTGEQTVEIEDVGHYVTVSERVLEDTAFVSQYIAQRLMFGVAAKVDEQVLSGNGTTPQLNGLLSVTGVQNLDYGTEASVEGGTDIMKAILQARIEKVEDDDGGIANGTVMSRSIWLDIALNETTAGGFYLGRPNENFAYRIWGMPVVLMDTGFGNASSDNTTSALVGDFANGCFIAARRGSFASATEGHIGPGSGMPVTVAGMAETGYKDDDFPKRLVTVRCYVRMGLATQRPSSFCKVTFQS